MQPRNPRYASGRSNKILPTRLFRKTVKHVLFLLMAVLLVRLVAFHYVGHVAADANTPVQPTFTQSICIDPGHGGEDPGAQNGKLNEADVVLKVAKKVAIDLRAKGYGVFMTRVTDKTLNNAQRVNFCNARKATILVSIHQNSYTDSGPDYATALQYKPEDAELANIMADAAGKALGLPVTPPMQFEDGMLMRAKMPSIIIESLFISNDTEAAAGDRVDLQAQGIVNGITSYLQAHKPVQTVPSNP